MNEWGVVTTWGLLDLAMYPMMMLNFFTSGG